MQFPEDKDKLVLNNSAISRASMACPYFRECTETARLLALHHLDTAQAAISPAPLEGADAGSEL